MIYPMSMQLPDPEQPNDRFLRILRGLLRPLVRLLIARGITAPAVYAVIKEVYIGVAERDFALAERETTDSRISLLTGIHRRDVKALRESPPDAGELARRKTSLLATVIGRWQAGSETTDGQGKPRILPRQSDAEMDFETLVRSVNRDMRPRTVLDELLRQGLVEIDNEDRVSLSEGAVVGPADESQKAVFFAANIGDHIAAAAENLQAEKPPHFERAVFYNRLNVSSVDALETLSRRLGHEALLQVNAVANEQQADDQTTEGPFQRFRFGLYFYREDDLPPKSAKNQKEV